MTQLLWCSAALLGLAWLVPLHVLPWMSWHNEALATTALLAGCAGGLWLGRRTAGGVRLPAPALVPCAVAAVAVLQWASGRIDHLGSVATIVSYAAVALAASAAGWAALRQTAEPGGPPLALRVLAQVTAAAALAQLLVGFGQVFSLWQDADWVARTIYRTRISGNLAQPNQAALLFVFGLASLEYLRLHGQLRTRIAVPLQLLVCLGIAMAESRSGLLAVCVLAGWYLVRRGPWPRAAHPAAVAGLVAFLLLVYVGWPPLAAAVWQFDGDEGINVTTSGRLEMWRQMAEAVALRPWTGWGVMQVAEAQNAVAHLYPKALAATFSHNLATTFSHNLLLDLAVWIGIPGMLACVAAGAWWLLPRVGQARTVDAAFCVAWLLALLTQSLTEFPYAYTFFLVPVFFAAGALDALLGRESGWRIPRPAAAGLLAVWMGLHGWAVGEYLAVEEDFRVARFEALRVGQRPAEHKVPQLLVLTQLENLLRATRLQPVPGMPAADIEVLRSAAMLHPWGATNFRYMVALALNGAMPEARRQWQIVPLLHGRKTAIALQRALDELAVEHPVLQELTRP